MVSGSAVAAGSCAVCRRAARVTARKSGIVSCTMPSAFWASTLTGTHRDDAAARASTATSVLLMRPPCPALVPQHRQLPLADVRRRAQLIEVHAARHLLTVVVAAIPIDVVLARGELAVRERADQAAGHVVEPQLHLLLPGDAEGDLGQV